jgi:uncharacterized protein (TIGR03435 family)
MERVMMLSLHRELTGGTDMKLARIISITFALTAFLCLAAYGQTPGQTQVQAQGQPPGPTFDVASIKPAPAPAGGRMMMGMQGGPGTKDPGLYRCNNCNLSMLVTEAYHIKYYQLSVPGSLETERFDISAKVPDGATKEQFRLMLQNLLAERFKLTIHRDQKEMQVYEMVVAKGGLKVKESVPEPNKDGAADPPPMTLGRAPLDKNGYPIIPKGCKGCMIVENDKARLVAEESTMKEFADRVGAQLGKPVHDLTGLTGKYDFDLTWGRDDTAARGSGTPEANTPLSTSSTGSAPADFQQMMIAAVQSEIGLKLEQKKGMVEIIVVDHAEKVPTEN